MSFLQNPITFGSVCSGIEAASVACGPLGWRASWLSEIEPFPCAVLAHYYPDVPNLGDMTLLPYLIRAGLVEAPDILCGGTPCQAFSVAGLRKSLDDERGNLSLTFCEIANAIDTSRANDNLDPCIVFWENVPGVLSTADNAFGCFLAGLAGEDQPLVAPGGRWSNAGYVLGPKRAVAWRVLDAQHFGLAQRRRRVFVVASARKGFDPAAVLFEFDGVRRDNAPRREAGKVAPTIPSRSTGGGGLGTDFDCDGGLILADPIARCVTAGEAKRQDWETCNFVAHSLRGEGFDASEDGTGCGTPMVPVAFHGSQAGALRQNPNSGPDGVGVQADHAYTLEARAEVQAVAFAQNSRNEVRLEGGDGQRCGALSTGGGKPGQGVPMIAFHPTQDPISSTDGSTHALGCGSTGGQASVAVAVALRGREGGATAELGDEVQNCLRASSSGGDKPYVLCETLYNKGLNHGGLYAGTQETHTGKILRTLREAVGEEAFAQWGLGILGSLQSPEILRQALHGLSIRPAAFSRSWVVHCALSRSENGSGWLLQSLREAGCERCASQGWEPSEQLTRELGAYLSELSQPGAQAARFVRDLLEASEGDGLLRQALSAVQEVGRSSGSETQSAHRTYAVRRLTVEECEFLQGFPRGYTRIPWRNKPADQCPDGPRYKALGNSWAVPVVRWIGARIHRAMGGVQ